jgi:hypothetical protein
MKGFTMAATMLAAALSVTMSAQKTTPMKAGSGGSEHVRTEWTIDGANISIEYGRPALKGRTPGKDIDPYEGMADWRRRADDAQDGQASENRHALGTGWHVRPPHDPGQERVATHSQQAAKRLGHPVSRGPGSRPRAHDDGQDERAG